MGLPMAYFWEGNKALKANVGLKGIKFKPLFKSYLLLNALGLGITLVESVFFDEYCDVDSYHYCNDLDRRKLA